MVGQKKMTACFGQQTGCKENWLKHEKGSDMSRTTKLIVALIGTALMMTFIIGLSYSISTGFAGFWGGLPFMIIAAIVILMALYDVWEDAIRKDD